MISRLRVPLKVPTIDFIIVGPDGGSESGGGEILGGEGGHFRFEMMVVIRMVGVLHSFSFFVF